MTEIEQAHVAILATDGFEKSELFEPKKSLEQAGARVSVLAPDEGSIKSWENGNWGPSIAVDQTLDGAEVSSFDALVLPGGQINPDVLRANDAAVRFVSDFCASGKTVAAICHGPWLLVEADAVRGRKVTSYHSIKTDLKNAGAHWEDSEVVCDNGLVTSRSPEDLEAFCSKIVEEVEEGRHARA